MKWYQKAVYRLATSVLPENIRQQMMGVGRVTVPKNANPWNVFNWLPKKYQTAHTIDLTKLQNYTAEELLELLVSVHPDVSHALYTYLRMGETGMNITATDAKGKPYKTGQATIDELRDMLNNPLPSVGYQHGRSLEKLDTIQRLMVMVRGACAGEVVLNDAINDVVDIVPVDPSLIWFRRDPATNRLVPWQYVNVPRYQQGEEWFGQYKKIDTPTFIYEELDPMVDDPYGRTPILPVLQVVFFHIQVLQDLKAVVHNQGYPRISVSMVEEIMLKNIPNAIKNDPNKQRQWLAERMKDAQDLFASLNPDDALFGWDSVKYEYVKGVSGPMINVAELINIIDTQLATSLKTLLTLLSRHQGSTETYSSVDVQLYIKTVESARNVTKRFWERAFSISARIRGVQTRVKLQYNPIDLRTENEIEKDRKAMLDNLVEAENNYYLTSVEAATKARIAIGVDPKIPTELLDKLNTKHEQPTQSPPPENTPPAAQRRVKLDNTEGSDNQDQSNVNEYIAFYLLMFGAMKEQMKHVTQIDRFEFALTMPEGLQRQNVQRMWQLYKDAYVESWNKRADESGADHIRTPDANTILDLHNEAENVVDGTTNTYNEEMQKRVADAVEQTKGIDNEAERLKKMKDLLGQWMDEYSAYKATQIANHEAWKAYHIALFKHDQQHAPDTLYDVEPGESEHEACLEIIAGAPYTLAQAQAQFLPLHPNCIHHYVPRREG